MPALAGLVVRVASLPVERRLAGSSPACQAFGAACCRRMTSFRPLERTLALSTATDGFAGTISSTPTSADLTACARRSGTPHPERLAQPCGQARTLHRTTSADRGGFGLAGLVVHEGRLAFARGVVCPGHQSPTDAIALPNTTPTTGAANTQSSRRRITTRPSTRSESTALPPHVRLRAVRGVRVRQ